MAKTIKATETAVSPDAGNETTTETTVLALDLEAHALSHRAAFTMAADEFDEIAFTVEKYKSEDPKFKLFRAKIDGKEYLNDKSANALLVAIAHDLSGNDKLKKTDLTLSGGEFVALSNEPEVAPLTDDEQTQLDQYAHDLQDFADQEESSKADLLASVLAVGSTLNSARALLVRYNDDGKEIRASNANWGIWVKLNMPRAWLKKGKNMVSEYMATAALPDAVVAAIPDGKASAKAITGWYAATRKSVIADCMEEAFSTLDSADNKLLRKAGYDHLMTDKGAPLLKKIIAEAGNAFRKIADDHAGIVEDVAKGPVFKADKDAAGNKVLDTKADNDRMVYYGKCAIAASYDFEAECEGAWNVTVMAAVKNAVAELGAAEAEKKAAAEAENAKGEEAERRVTQELSEMSEKDAAAYICELLLGHADPAEVLRMAQGMIVAKMEEAAAAEAAAAEAAESADAEANG